MWLQMRGFVGHETHAVCVEYDEFSARDRPQGLVDGSEDRLSARPGSDGTSRGFLDQVDLSE